MIEVWYSEKLILSDNTNTTVDAVFDNTIRADSVALHIIYVKGSETSVRIQPLGMDNKIPGEFPVQRFDGTTIANLIIDLSSGGSYTIPIPLVKAWDTLKLRITFVGDTTSMGSLYIYAIPDYQRG